jgi:hypothetical protein
MDPDPQVWLGDDGVMRVRLPKDFALTLESMRTVNDQHRRISMHKRPVLIYAESVASASFEGQQYASHERVIEVVAAMAIIVKSVFTRALADIFMKFHRPVYPTRVFNSEAAAIQWLKEVCPDCNQDRRSNL